MEFKGTKGEWEVDNNTGGVFSTDKNETGNIICLEPEYFDDSLKNWEANAQLIATAPELLKALQGLLDDFKYYISEQNEEPTRAGYIDFSEKTINKALGK